MNEEKKEITKEERSKLGFCILINSGMRYYESFYREDIDIIKDSSTKVPESLSSKKAKNWLKQSEKVAKDKVKNLTQFGSKNYSLVDSIARNLSEGQMEKIENVSDTLGIITEGLLNKDTQLDYAILIALYEKGLLREFIDKVKLNNKEDESKAVK